MKKNILYSVLRLKILPYGIMLAVLILTASLSFAFAHKPLPKNENSKKVKNIAKIAPSQTPTAVPPKQIQIKKVLGVSAIMLTNTPVPQEKKTLPTPKIESAASQNINTSQQASSVAPTSTPTPQPTVAQAETLSKVNLQVQTPDENGMFSITLKNGANVCDVLEEGKNEGKIRSVTFDDSYLSSLHSKYVTEINGFMNNWTFTVNGSGPLGCSLSYPKPNDLIIWKFG